ncbi:MAG: ATP-binding protein [Beduini sp.]|uniref:HAMP domain-containing sensor histidine kinase n=1 Tax=Beduini sp. TaxID=1922300 RepID=UPI0039A3F713
MSKRLTLLQQLGLLVMGILLLIIFVVSPLINRNLNNLVSSQMFETIQANQLDYLKDYYNPYDKGKEKQVYHITRRIVNDAIQWEAIPPLTVMTTRDMVQELFSKNVAEQTETIENYIAEYHGQKIYYTITKLADDGSYIISFVYNDYSTELLNSIKNELVYVQYIVLFIVALIMTIWVFTFIKPLQKIKNYIETIKRGEKGILDIERNDEIGQVSMALVDMKNELDQQEKLKEEFMHNISHDLKTPIAVIKSYAESMKDDIYPYGTKESSLDVILENTERLENKVQSFLYLNRLDYINQDELILDDVNMNELIGKIKSQLDVSDEIITVIENTEALIFKGQEEHWRNVLENIIENAKRYYQHQIIITIDEFSISIFNDGPTINQKLLKEIFKPYSKGEKGNFGLGLSIVKKVVDMYGYAIQVENMENGVTFKITNR